MDERLQKILSRAGYGSRRGCEELITKGYVTVNGEVAVLGMKADPDRDDIRLKGEPIGSPEQLKYIALYKPRHVISSVKPIDHRKTVIDLIPEGSSLFPVGRLDSESEGLILLTNDGELTNQLTHPSFNHEKEYKVLVASRPDGKQLNAWKNGVVLEDGYRTRPADVRVTATHGKGAWMQVILREGRKRQIREMGRLTGLPVVRIIRTRTGTLKIGNLKPGQWRHLSQQELQELKASTSGIRLKRTSPKGKQGS